MKLLVVDGNSIANRAFYGIRLLSTKNGEFTNALFGFLNILQRLRDLCEPDGIAVAFDVHARTFRHKMYDVYKAGRKGMPDELRSQMPVLKELLTLMGCTVCTTSLRSDFFPLRGIPVRFWALRVSRASSAHFWAILRSSSSRLILLT